MKSMLKKYVSVFTLFALCVTLCACGKSLNCNAGHTWKLISTTATCFAGGVESYECEICKTTKTESVAAYEHNYVLSSRTEPTCKTNGEEIMKCSRCGFESKTTLLVIAHDYQVKSATPATCIEKGSQILECLMCHETKTEILEPIEHDFKTFESPMATCFSNGSIVQICLHCNLEEFISSTDLRTHKFGENGYCSECGVYKTFIDAEKLNITYEFNNTDRPELYIKGYLLPKFISAYIIPDDYLITHQISVTVYLYGKSSGVLDYYATKSIVHNVTTISRPTLTLPLSNIFSAETLKGIVAFKMEFSCDGYEKIEKTFNIT